jgi:hypothetical protein
MTMPPARNSVWTQHKGCIHNLCFKIGEACTVSQIFTQRDFNNLFPNANGAANQAKPNQYPIYSYKNLLEAAQTFPTFSCTGNVETRKRELVAFLAQTSQQTSNWWDGEPYIWGYFYSTEKWIEGDYCNSTNTEFPCVLGKKYYGRGPMHIEYNDIYGKVSNGLWKDNSLLTDPEKILRSGVAAFQTALWIWMTPQTSFQPSCHDVITGSWLPSPEDKKLQRKSGFGMTTNLISGKKECAKHTTLQATKNRIGYFTTYAKYFNIPTGDNLDCENMTPY